MTFWKKFNFLETFIYIFITLFYKKFKNSEEFKVIVCPRCGTSQEFEYDVGTCIKCGLFYQVDPAFHGVGKAISPLEHLECLKCGSTSCLGFFTHQETIRKVHHYKMQSFVKYNQKFAKIPLCETCYEELTRWVNNNTKILTRSTELITSVIIAVGLIGGMINILRGGVLGSIFTILCFTIAGSTIYYVIKRDKLKSQDNSPFKYASFRSKKVFVRPKGQGKWIKYDKWLSNLNARIPTPDITSIAEIAPYIGNFFYDNRGKAWTTTAIFKRLNELNLPPQIVNSMTQVKLRAILDFLAKKSLIKFEERDGRVFYFL